MRSYCIICQYLQTGKNGIFQPRRHYTTPLLQQGCTSTLPHLQFQSSNSVISHLLSCTIRQSRNLCSLSHNIDQNRSLQQFQQWTCKRLFSSTGTRNCAYSRGWSRRIVCCIPKELRKSPPWRILFFGTDEFSLETLKALNENRLSNDSKVSKLVDSLDVTVIRPKEPQTHHAVLEYALKHDLTVYDWPVIVSPFHYDVGVLASFGCLVPESVIFKFPYGIINVHPSLLPRWRGAAPISHTILNGDKETGISIMEIRPKYFDIGPLLLKVKFEVPENTTTSELTAHMAEKGAKVLMHTLPILPELEKLEVEQDKAGVTWAHKITEKMGVIDWKNHNCEKIDQMYRALHERFPLTTKLKGDTIKLMKMRKNVNDEDTEKLVKQRFDCSSEEIQPGFPMFCKKKKCLLVKCKDGWVGFDAVGHTKKLSSTEFYGVYKRIYRDEIFTSPPQEETSQTAELNTKQQTKLSTPRTKRTGGATQFVFHLYGSQS